MTKIYYETNELYHYGVLGMRWGHRKKYYNSDGSLNKLGKAKTKKQLKTKDVMSSYKEERKRQKQHLAKKRAVTYGTMFANSYLNRHNTTLNGKDFRINSGVPALINYLLDYKYAKDSFK